MECFWAERELQAASWDQAWIGSSKWIKQAKVTICEPRREQGFHEVIKARARSCAAAG
jgi:hypothetical protein